MGFSDLRDFLNQLEDERQLVRISQPISTRLEMTEVPRLDFSEMKMIR